MSSIPCPATGVYVSGHHLTTYPRSHTSPVSYCPTCLGFGTVTPAPVTPCTCPDLWSPADVAACPVHGGTICTTHGHPMASCPGWRECCA